LLERVAHADIGAFAAARGVVTALQLGARIDDVEVVLDLAFRAALIEVVTGDLRDLVAEVVFVRRDRHAIFAARGDKETDDRKESYAHNISSLNHHEPSRTRLPPPLRGRS